ncbi:MAG: Lrp/AsnC family transcriptional regulator [Halovenus sp.]
MPPHNLDEVDMTILYLLQKDARNYSAAEIAEEVDVTPSTVRNRIQALREDGIIDKFVPVIDYERAGFPFRVLIVCTAPVSERKELVQKAKAIDGVTFVRELMTGTRNVHVAVAAADSETITEIGNSLNDIGLGIETKEQIVSDSFQQFEKFGTYRRDE